MKTLKTFTHKNPHDWRLFNLVVVFQLQIAIFMSLAGLSPAGASSAGDANSGSRQILWGAMGIISLSYILMTKFAQRDRQFSLGGWPMILALVYVSASTAWSISPVITAKRAILLIILVLVCGVSTGSQSKDWRRDTFSTTLAKPLGLLLILSLLLTILMPSRAFSDIGWRGTANHKNEAGQMMAIATVLLMYGLCHARVRLKHRISLVILVFGGLLMTKSTTALLGLTMGVAITEFASLRLRVKSLGSWRIVLGSILLMASAATFFALQFDLLPPVSVIYAGTLELFGKSDTFTGRTEIWNLVLGESRFHNPWIGGGYGGFWAGRDSISGYVLLGNNLYPGQAHNGYIDIYNDLGFVGLGVLAIVIISALCNAVRLLWINHSEGKLHLAIIILCVFLNLGESTFLRNITFLNIIFISSVIRSSEILRRSRLEHEQSAQQRCLSIVVA